MSDALVTVGIQSSGGSGTITVIKTGSGNSYNTTVSFSTDALFAILTPTGGKGGGISNQVIGNPVLLFSTGSSVTLSGYYYYSSVWNAYTFGSAKLSTTQLTGSGGSTNNLMNFNYIVIG